MESATIICPHRYNLQSGVKDLASVTNSVYATTLRGNDDSEFFNIYVRNIGGDGTIGSVCQSRRVANAEVTTLHQVIYKILV
jgi:hypothetical protein